MTKIEWADKTVNLAWGCQKVSPGCKHCYAERISAVRARHPNPKIAARYEGVVDSDGHWTGRVNLAAEKFPSLPRKGCRIFVGSMTDIFQVGVPQVFLVKLWQWMEAYSQHTFQILTKRPERMADFLGEYFPSPLHNVWGMTTVCNQSEADGKIPHLLSAPLAVRGVSIEPMLGPVDLFDHLFSEYDKACMDIQMMHPHAYSHEKINWIICGGETGPGARPMHPNWVRSLRDQCQHANTPFFFKGWGEWVTENQSPEDIVLPGHSRTPRGWKGRKYEDSVYRVGKRRAGRLLDGREWNEVPEVSC